MDHNPFSCRQVLVGLLSLIAVIGIPMADQQREVVEELQAADKGLEALDLQDERIVKLENQLETVCCVAWRSKALCHVCACVWDIWESLTTQVSQLCTCFLGCTTVPQRLISRSKMPRFVYTTCRVRDLHSVPRVAPL